MVRKTIRFDSTCWPVKFWFDIHRTLLCVDISMELQVLPRLWLLIWRIRYFNYCRWDDIYHCRLLLPQRRKLQLAMDCLWIWGIHVIIRVLVWHLLLHLQDPNARTVAILLLFRLYVLDRHQFGAIMRYNGPRRS